ncbi:UPF0057-domain-containing protein [Dendrothele bispora CBS 962.96]|uniref:UPF0057-domain-containing protein n=1 Tax=Dendrothele bispora (strain CBS 962.96) TaxID=1314807 RepID=A0A4S8LCJ6_DENBC|nr:UPF0057-domain-containing protein [Dendrothele bispora CBS 962.96]
MAFTTSDICKILVAIFLPPLGVFFERGCGADFLINILLTILGWLPGIIHGAPPSSRIFLVLIDILLSKALYIILKY